jgi:hypothetical protein
MMDGDCVGLRASPSSNLNPVLALLVAIASLEVNNSQKHDASTDFHPEIPGEVFGLDSFGLKQ